MIVGKVFPGGAAGAVVLAHRAPLALAQIRSPVLPATRGPGTLAADARVRGSSQRLARLLGLSDFVLELYPRAQYLSDAPGLREAAARNVRRVTIENLADRAQAGAFHMFCERVQERLGQRAHRHRRGNERGRRVPGARPTPFPDGRPHRVAKGRPGSGRCSPGPAGSSCAGRSSSASSRAQQSTTARISSAASAV